MKKIINPQPIIDRLVARCLTAKGVECSVLGEVIDMLRTAPDLGEGAGFVLLDDMHVSANQIRSFSWKDGDQLTARYAKEGEDFLLEEMRKIGFLIVDKTVICCVDQNNEPVPTKRAIEEGYLDAYISGKEL